jgi:predicted nucleic acid-binding protein
MRRYLDTSLIVAALVRESGTDAAKAYLSAARAEFLLASRWVVTELSSALDLKVRTGTITAAEQTAALAMFRRFSGARLRLVDVEALDFDTGQACAIKSPLRCVPAMRCTWWFASARERVWRLLTPIWPLPPSRTDCPAICWQRSEIGERTIGNSSAASFRVSGRWQRYAAHSESLSMAP